MGIMQVVKTLAQDDPRLHVLTDEELKALQKALFGMVKDIAETCEKHHILWCLSGGSALGAVRHKGFIPWDDDMDIFMMREDFEKFKKVFPKEMSDKYYLRCPGDKGYLYHFPRIYKKGTRARSIQSNDVPYGISIDFFLMENTYDNGMKRKFHGAESTFYLMVDSLLRIDACKKTMLEYGGKSAELRKAVKLRSTLSVFFKFRSLEKWLASSDKCFSKVKTAGRYLVVPSGAKHFFGEIYDREKMYPPSDAEFCGMTVKVPHDVDYYLKSRYGNDYMTPPPADKQEKHVFVEFNLFGDHV